MTSLRSKVKTNPWLRGTLFAAQNARHAVRRPIDAGTGGGRPRRRLTAMVRVKDEARFLPEWLAHHVNLGVEHVAVYDNNSSDDIGTVMAPFVERGLATIVPWPTVPASPGAHLDFLRRLRGSSQWVAFFDADEFLVEQTPGALADLLSSTPGPALAVNWRYYGSAGHETVPAGLVTEHFDRADPEHNHHVKVIARPGEIVAYRNSHNFYYRHGRLARTSDHRRVLGSFAPPPGDAWLELRHYVYRSREDYERKARHGFVDASGAKDRARQTTRADGEFHRHNDVRAPMPPAVLEGTARLLAELGYSSDIYRSPRDAEADSRG
jgi:Glycosyltransferase family 92